MKYDGHWRDSSRIPKFFMVDARAVIPAALCIFHFRSWTFAICIIFLVFCTVINYKKLSLSYVLGKVKNALLSSSSKSYMKRL